MTEEFLHYIWKYRVYSPDLHLFSGEPVVVVHPGDYNTDAGPDFFNARIRIGTTLWAGNVEIHLSSSDWFRHHHHLDKAYDNIILHVVFHHDKVYPKLEGLATLELKNCIRTDSWQLYLKFMANRSWIPCECLIQSVDRIQIVSWLDRLLIERIERKTQRVENALTRSSNDWNQTFYRLLARTMGFKLNDQAFEMLANSLSFIHLLRHSDNLLQLEAMVFGQAGLLTGVFQDEYPRSLQAEFSFLQKKFSLLSMEGSNWRFMRMHPNNFPTLRLSQFCSVIHKSGGMMISILEKEDIRSIRSMFEVKATDYWKTHFRFDASASPSDHRLGSDSIDLILINLVAPFLFVLGKKRRKENLVELALYLLENLNADNNTVIRRWLSLGVKAETAGQSQALLELTNSYCKFKKCLSCRIGTAILSESVK